MVAYKTPMRTRRYPHIPYQSPPTMGENCETRYGHVGLNVTGRSMAECPINAGVQNCSTDLHHSTVGRVVTGRKTRQKIINNTIIVS